ncbi:MAG: hypothetical protein C4548_02385 [Desulfobacteraceae bacterium]|jgi:hypothetical protein|nr:MAG: hypothetical protein C4548_02385 [Desulfobacteraceae bacterium]
MPLSATQEEISAYQEKVQKNIFFKSWRRHLHLWKARKKSLPLRALAVKEIFFVNQVSIFQVSIFRGLAALAV